MYEIKNVIKKMKQAIDATSNIELANYLQVSYNTLNTWMKRGKIPQEILFDFCRKNNLSCDELILNKTLSTSKYYELIYYGLYKDLNINFKAKLQLTKEKLFNNAYYLLKKEDIFFIAKVSFNPFYKECQIELNEENFKLSLEEFNTLNQGLIISCIPE